MKIFGYEITKVRKVKKVVIDTRTFKPRIEIRFDGDGWEFSDAFEFKPLITSHFNNLSDEDELPKMTTEQKVHILKIFYKDFCEFEIIK